MTWINDLATEGSITVETVTEAPPLLDFSQADNNLRFSSPSNFRLQVKTNSLDSDPWVNGPGGGPCPGPVPFDVTAGLVFVRRIFLP